MKAYKGFNKDMTCRGIRFKEGETYETDEAKLCESGFHACETPVDCFAYYSPASSVYHEVDLDASDERREDDTKRVGKRITIGARLDIAGMCRAHFEYRKQHCTNENNTDNNGAASAGYYGAASAGYRGAASAGNYGAASAGDCGAASAGNWGAVASRGLSSVGKNGIACARGNNVRVRGGMGAILVIAEENSDDYTIKNWSAVVVDGEKIKPDTWYKLVGRRLIKCDEDNVK